MSSIVFDDFSGGLDLRQSASMAEANLQRVLKNCYITTGKKIQKRPCLTRVATLEPGTVGLRAAGGKLNTFYGPGTTITHANTLFRANRVAHHLDTARAPIEIHYGENFNGFLYVAVEYDDGTFRHHYLNDPGSWLPNTAYGAGVFRRPSSPNGFRYEATTGGTSHAATEPAWPLAVGATVVDNTVTWTCRSFAVTDVNCPHSHYVAKLQQKIYAADNPNTGDVAYCKTSDPTDWTAASDAGFIPSSIHAAGSDTVTALGDFRGDLSIFFADSTQLWDVDSDPSLNLLKDVAENIGTMHHDAVLPFANDLLFLAKPGFRSIALTVLTDNLEEADVGSAIDALRSEILDTDSPTAIFYPSLGQLWVINGTKVYELSYSKTRKISAWATYEFPMAIEAQALLNNELYLRSGDVVYRADQSAFADDGVAPLCEVEMYYQDAETPGILKQFMGCDVVTKGQPEVAFRFDPRNPSLQTTYLPLAGGRTEPVYYLDLPGVAGNYASTPDSVALGITADMEIRISVALDDWSPAAITYLMSNYAQLSTGSWLISVKAGGGLLGFEWVDAGGTLRGGNSTAAPIVADGALLHLKYTLDADNGAGGHDVKFWTSSVGINGPWTQLGATTNGGAFTTSIKNGTDPLKIDGFSNNSRGKIYRAQVYNGINGVKVIDFEPRLIDKNTMQGVMWTEERWTVSQSGATPAIIGFVNELVTDPHQTLVGDTRPGDLLPMELQAVALAPIFRHQANEDFGVELVQAYYENLAAV